MKKKSIIGIVSAYRPTLALVQICEDLLESNFDQVIIIDDGNNDISSAKIFTKLQSLEGTHVIVHHENQGQGAGIKSAVNFLIDEEIEYDCIVLFDADGQHLTEDIIHVSHKTLEIGEEAIVVGVRDFSGREIPIKSFIGNNLTRNLLKFVFKIDVQDSQCGLRGFGRLSSYSLLKPKANRYEYLNELNLLTLKKNFLEVPITTVYFDNNKHSSFRPIADSAKIYSVYLKKLLGRK